ncbi:Ig lambda chain V-I region BL2 [Myotis brandtii]|uniref:Ig lambda chain V-I region BL2 n=1 Tax=Myotis brandtii TaxID=109478 RepID=S7NKD3_MYOBR|nr:Ig lambda chain V-I region BL2 [Myotis brandtii]
MAWAPLLLALLAHSSGSGVRAGLTQEASLSGSLGQKVTLSCTGNSNNVGTYGVGWYQQVTGSAPKTVMLGSSRPTGIPDRFSGSQSGNTASLVITGLQPEDEAVYYCSTWDYGISNHTVLHTHGELRQKPALFPLIAPECRDTEAVAVADPIGSDSRVLLSTASLYYFINFLILTRGYFPINF